MIITGTHFNYYQVCKRKLWLFSNRINYEGISDLVFEGRLIHQESYPNRSDHYKEIEVGGIKIDYYDAKNKVIHEIKKSNKIESAHQWQLKYYIYVLRQNGIKEASGILEYPTLKRTEKVILTDEDSKEIEDMLIKITQIIENGHCPASIDNAICNKCSYFDFCYSGEPTE